MNDGDLPGPDELPLELLLRLARREVEDEHGDAASPFLVALNRRPTREVFDRAAALVSDGDVTQRELGVRILRELGDEQSDGCRPFRDETVALMRDRLRDETDPAVLRWIVSALGGHRGKEALPRVVALAGHPDDRVRFHVAAALPSLVDVDRVEAEAADALIRLCHDDDADTRYYALYAATRELGGLDVQVVSRLTVELADDPDQQVRAMAAAHHEAVGEVRDLLTEGLGTGTYDHLIGPVLCALDCAGDAADAPLWLDEVIRRHLGPAATRFDPSRMAQELVSWWADRQGWAAGKRFPEPFPG